MYSNLYPLAGHRPPIRQLRRPSTRHWATDRGQELNRNASQVREVLQDIAGRDIGGERRHSTRASSMREWQKKNGNWSTEQLR